MQTLFPPISAGTIKAIGGPLYCGSYVTPCPLGPVEACCRWPILPRDQTVPSRSLWDGGSFLDMLVVLIWGCQADILRRLTKIPC